MVGVLLLISMVCIVIGAKQLPDILPKDFSDFVKQAPLVGKIGVCSMVGLFIYSMHFGLSDKIEED